MLARIRKELNSLFLKPQPDELRSGLGRIASTGPAFILEMEAGESASVLDLLKEIGVNGNLLKGVMKFLSRWYGMYEKLCRKEVVRRLTGRIVKEVRNAFLMEGRKRHQDAR